MFNLNHVPVAHHAGGVIRSVPNLHISYSAFFGCHHSRTSNSSYIPSFVLLTVFLRNFVAVGNWEQVKSAGLIVR